MEARIYFRTGGPTAKDLIQVSVLSLNQDHLKLSQILRAKIHLLLFNLQNPIHWRSLHANTASAHDDILKKTLRDSASTPHPLKVGSVNNNTPSE